MKELEYPFNADMILRKSKKIKKDLLSQMSSECMHKKIAILGGSTTDILRKTLELFLLDHGIVPEFYESGYNQYYEDAMFPDMELRQFAPDYIYIYTTNRNIQRYPHISDNSDAVEKLLNQEIDKYTGMWEHIAEIYKCPVIQNNFEMPTWRILGNRDAWDIHGATYFVNRLNMYFGQYAREHHNFYICDLNYISADYGLNAWIDPFYWYMYKYAAAVPAIPYLAQNVANMIKAIAGKNKKAIVLDLDNTLWGGIIGEDGAGQIEIGPETSKGQAYTEFQEYIKRQKEIGAVLTINSKNDGETAMKGFDNAGSVLNKEDFVAVKANWNPKDRNIYEIAQELNLLPESFVFIDDNPAERELIRQKFPEIAVPEMNTPEQFISILSHNGFFETVNLSEDDVNRTQMYMENIKRIQSGEKYSDYGAFLKSLEMHAIIRPFDTMNLSRIVQLINKSNQFNLTARRYALPDIEQIIQNEKYITIFARLKDKFGDNGITSSVIGKIIEHDLHIELWVMSCRVMKRNLEFAMMDEMVKVCQRRRIHRVIGYYNPTNRNGMVKDFFGELGFARIDITDNGKSVWEYKVDKNYVNKNQSIQICSG